MQIGIGIGVSQRPTGGAASLVSPDVVILLRSSTTSARPHVNQILSANSPSGVALSNAVDVNGGTTTVGFSLVAIPETLVGNGSGNSTLQVSPYFLAGDLGESWYVQAETREFSITGLNPAKTYRVVMAGSRAVVSTDLTRLTDIAIVAGTIADGGAATRGYSAADPASGTTAGNVVFEITPTTGGVITFDLKRSASNTAGFAYLGGIYLKPL